MNLGDALDELGDVLDGQEMTGRQAAIIIGIWMGVTVAFGVIAYLVVFVYMGY
ncbi:hypothetical protein [Halopiger djelfimassiliensis]|uniref:hypothetical protein n=1 Tax=Halopiger djelfimassiliensis TaxID=1293047 RepID=UPI000B25EC5D|nr:hypothetical protein [Halopiger djelfimassiliensis]